MRIRRALILGSMGLALLSSLLAPFADPLLELQRRSASSTDVATLRQLAWRAAGEVPLSAVDAAVQSLPSPLARTLLLSAVIERSAARSPETAARLAALIPSTPERCSAWLTCLSASPSRDDWTAQALAAARSCALPAERCYWLDRIASAIAPVRPQLAGVLRDEASREAASVGA